MTALSNYAELKILDLLFENTAYTAPNAYLALFTSDPTDAGSGNEVAALYDYARVLIDDKMSSASAGSITNNANITFAPANGGSFGTVTHIGIYDASTSGNLTAHGILAAAKQIDDGDTFQITTGSLTISID